MTILVSMITDQMHILLSDLPLPHPNYFAALLLIILLVAKELILSGVESEQIVASQQTWMKSRMLNTYIVPLLLVFAWTVVNEAIKLV